MENKGERVLTQVELDVINSIMTKINEDYQFEDDVEFNKLEESEKYFYIGLSYATQNILDRFQNQDLKIVNNNGEVISY